MDEITARLLVKMVMKTLDDDALVALFAARSPLRQTHIVRLALNLDFSEAKELWKAFRILAS